MPGVTPIVKNSVWLSSLRTSCYEFLKGHRAEGAIFCFASSVNVLAWPWSSS